MTDLAIPPSSDPADDAADDDAVDRSTDMVLDSSRTAASDAAADATRAVVGRGFTFPLVVDAAGSLTLDRGDDVGPAIRMIVLTAPGERPMRPDFGCSIWELLYAPINAATLGQMEHAVRQALSRWEPRIDVERVLVEPESDGVDGVVTIAVDYRLRASNDRRNLVFPFYVIPEEGRR